MAPGSLARNTIFSRYQFIYRIAYLHREKDIIDFDKKGYYRINYRNTDQAWGWRCGWERLDDISSAEQQIFPENFSCSSRMENSSAGTIIFRGKCCK